MVAKVIIKAGSATSAVTAYTHLGAEVTPLAIFFACFLGAFGNETLGIVIEIAISWVVSGADFTL
jgi:hypothetical protein